MQPAIYTQDLVKTFKTDRGKLTAVDHVTLEIQPGEMFGLIGPDGAGKTTIVRLILGLLSRTSGKSGVMGCDSMRDLYGIRSKVGYIAQQFALSPDLTVLENMRFFARVHCISTQDERQRIPDLLELAGLSNFTARLAGHLSGGMKKKLALACSLVHQPPVVVLDEPTLGVDPVSRREFWTLLGNLRVDKGLTILVCTPYMDEAERCHRVGLMYAGRMIACDTPDGIKSMAPGQLLEFSPHPFVAARDLATTLEGVLEVQTYGATLHLFVDNLQQRRSQIEAAMLEAGIHISGMRVMEARMEETFISLISHLEADDRKVRETQ